MFLMIDPTASCEKKLWVAVLIQAIKDRQRPKVKENYHSGRRYIDAAHQWFESSEDGIGSFNWICFILDLDPEKLLTGINEQGFRLKNENGNIGKLGIAIRKFREDHGIIQRELGKWVGLSQRLIWNIENGEIRKSLHADKIWDFIPRQNDGGQVNNGDNNELRTSDNEFRQSDD